MRVILPIDPLYRASSFTQMKPNLSGAWTLSSQSTSEAVPRPPMTLAQLTPSITASHQRVIEVLNALAEAKIHAVTFGDLVP